MSNIIESKFRFDERRLNQILIFLQRSLDCCRAIGHNFRRSFTPIIRQRISIYGPNHWVGGLSCSTKH